MGHPPIAYMEWAKGNSHFQGTEILNCATSGIMPLRNTLRELTGEDAADLVLAGGDPYGNRELQAAIAWRYSVDVMSVFPAIGTSMANYALFAGLLESGDTVLVESPAYEPLTAAPAALGARVVPFQRRSQDNWAINTDEVITLAKEEKARLVVLTNPHNPSFAWTSDDDIAAIADGVGEDVVVLVDEVYREWGHLQAGETVACKRPNIAVTSSLTKVYGLSRLRAGWIIANDMLLHRASRAYDHMGVVGPAPVETIAARVIADDDLMNELRGESISIIEVAKTHFTEWLETSESVHNSLPGQSTPDGAGYTLLHCDRDLGGKSFADWLLDEHNILTVPGEFFNLSPQYVRFSWTQGEETAQAAVEKLRDL